MRWFYIVLLFVASLYFVIGGISFIIVQEEIEHALDLPVDEDMKNGPYPSLQFQYASEEYEKLEKFFPTKALFGNTLFYLIILMSFGIMGTILQLLLNILRKGEEPIGYNIYAMTILGSVIGLMTIVISEFIPEFKNESGNNKFYYTIALLGGIYTEEFYDWLSEKFKGIVSRNNSPDNSPSS